MSKVTVLFADDTKVMHMLVSGCLAKSDFEIVANAYNGKEAVDLYAKHKPDLVVLDMKMPDTDGLYALSGIRQSDDNAVVIMAASEADNESFDLAKRMGAKERMKKPYDEKHLIAALENARRSLLQ